jgi:hypothetical protein
MGFKSAALVDQTIKIAGFHPLKYYDFRMGIVDLIVTKIAIKEVLQKKEPFE